jgi:hypothetical protein
VFVSHKTTLTRDVEEPAYKPLSIAHGGHFAAQPAIES